MIVFRIAHAQGPALSEDVIGIQGNRRLVMDDRQLQAGVPDQAGRLVGLIADVPVVVRIGGEGESVRPHGPVHGAAHGVVPGGIVLQPGLGHAVPGLGEPGPGVRREFQVVAAPVQADVLHDAEVLRRIGDEVGRVVQVGVIGQERIVIKDRLVFVLPILVHIQPAGAHVTVRIGIIDIGVIGNGEVGLGDRDIEHDPGTHIIGVLAVYRERILAEGLVVPGGVHDGILVQAALQIDAGGEEGLLVRILELETAVVVEVRLQGRVAEGHGQRVGVVQHRHELRGGRLAAAAVVEQPDIGVVVEVVEEHGARGPVQDPGFIRILMPGRFIVLILRISRESELGPDTLFLVHEGHSGTLVDVTVQDPVGIVLVHVTVPDIHHGMGDRIVVIAAHAVQQAVVNDLFGVGLTVIVLVTAFQVKIAAEGLGVHETGAGAPGTGRLVHMLVHQRRVFAVVSFGQGLVVAVGMVVRQVPGRIQGEGAAGHPEPLAEQEETVGGPVAVHPVVLGETAVHPVGVLHPVQPGIEDAGLVIGAVADVELRLEEDGRVVGELVLQADAHPVPVVSGKAGIVRLLILGGAVRHVGFLIGILQGFGAGTAVHVIAGELHLFVQQVVCAVHAAHPGSGDTAVPEAAEAAHAPAAAHHLGHHVAAPVGEAHAAGAVVAVGDDRQLGAVREAAYHGIPVEPPVVHVVFLGRDVVAGTGRHRPDQTLHHAFLDGQVDDGLVLSVVDAGELGLFGFLLHDFHLFDHLGRKVLRGELRVVQEEGLPVDGDLVDGLAVCGDGTVVIYLNAREFLQQVDEHVRISRLERRSVILHGILLDDDRVARRGNGSGVQDFLVQFQFDGPEVGGAFLDLHIGRMGPVAHDFGFQGVFSGPYLLDGTLALMVGQGILGIALGGSQGYGGEAHRLAVGGILEFNGHIEILGLERQGGEQAHDRQKNPSHCHTVRTNTHYSLTKGTNTGLDNTRT